MVSYGGKPDVEVFAKYFILHRQARRVHINRTTHDCNYGSSAFKPHPGIKSGLMHCSRNHWDSSWSHYWFYVEAPCEERMVDGKVVRSWPLASRLVDSNCIYRPAYNVPDGSQNEATFREAYHYTSNRDLVEEFLAARLRPLHRDFRITKFMAKKVPGRDSKISCPVIDIDLKGRNAAGLVKWISKIAESFSGKYPLKEHELVETKTATGQRLNRVLFAAGIPYPPRSAPGETDDTSVDALQPGSTVRKRKRTNLSDSSSIGASKSDFRKKFTDSLSERREVTPGTTFFFFLRSCSQVVWY